MIVDSKIIAVDFDGTIVENKYPKIGKPVPFAFETLKLLEKDGHRLILWTVREGDRLQEAIDFCQKNGVSFHAINESFPGEGKEMKSRKLNADIFIDDRNVMGFPGWGEIYHFLNPHEKGEKARKEKGFFKRLFS